MGGPASGKFCHFFHSSRLSARLARQKPGRRSLTVLLAAARFRGPTLNLYLMNAQLFWNKACGFGSRTGFSLALLAGLFAVAGTTNTDAVVAASPQDDVANNLAQTALNAFNAKDWQHAAGKFQELLDKHPEYQHRAQARHNLGLCQVNQNLFTEAARSFQTAIKELPVNSTETLAAAHFYLGFCQLELGRAAAKTDAAESNRMLTTASATFTKVIKDFPDFASNHEALFYQGNAFEELKRNDEAKQSYAKVVIIPNATFRLDALFALAWLESGDGQHDKAIEHYRQFLKQGENNPAVNEVRFRAADSLWKLAIAADGRGDKEAFDSAMAEALELLTTVEKVDDFPLRDQALFLFAAIADKKGELETSAEMFAKVAEMPESPLRSKAVLNAGLQYVQAAKPELATRFLEEALKESDETIAAQAAHELSRQHRVAGNHQKAFAIAKEWTDKASNPAMKADLLFDQAEAALQLPAEKAKATDLFAEVVSTAPKSAIAPLALYNAAWTSMQSARHDRVLEMAKQFYRDYAGHDYLPFMQEVEAESLIATNQSEPAIAVLKSLVQNFAEHKEHPQWLVILAAEQLRSGDAASAIQTAAQVISKKEIAAGIRAEAFFWTGLAQNELKQPAEAISALQSSLTESRDWKRADQTLGTLAEYQATADEWEAATNSFGELKSQHAESVAVAETALHLGAIAFDGGKFDQAKTWYDLVREGYSASPLYVPALAGSGWTELKLGNVELAAKYFRIIVDENSGHELATDAARGLASALRTGGDSGMAIETLRKQIGSSPEGTDNTDLRYELILALVQSKQSADVEKEIASLLQIPASEKIADRLHYELAWALQDQKRPDEALEQFKLIVRDFPASPVASDSHFQLGEFEYGQEKFALATTHYRDCLKVAGAPENVRERAAYKLGWSLFRQNLLPEAYDQFVAHTNEFPEGDFHADGLFMAAESLFAQKRFDKALKSYNDSKAVFETSQRIQPNNRALAWLHGSQSANMAGQHDVAIEFAKKLTDDEAASESFRQDAWLEIGNALKEQNKLDDAYDAWAKAATSLGKTGARAYCLMGDKLFFEKQFDAAIEMYKNVYYGFGGSGENPDVDSWQAFAIYEAAVCHLVQIETAEGSKRADLIEKARALFEKLVKEHPGDQNTDKAKKDIRKLEALAGASK